MYVLYFKGYQQECQIIIININLGSVWHLICSGCPPQPSFLAKREISFEVSTFEGSLFSVGSLLSGFGNTCDILSLLFEVCYFRGVVTFATLRQLVVVFNCKITKTAKGLSLINIYFYSYGRPGVIADIIKADKSGFHGSRKGVFHNRLSICVSLEHLGIKM